MRKAAQTAALGKPFLVDVGVFGKNRYFVYVAAFGAFTEVSYSTPQETKNILGHQAYMLEAIKRLTGLKSYRMRLAWEHLGEQRELEEEFILGMVTNTTSIGGFKGLVGMDVALDHERMNTMTTLELILTIIQLLSGLAVTVIVLMQSGKSAGLSGAIAGGAETFLSKGKAKTLDAKLAKATKWFGLVFVVLTLVLTVLMHKGA